MLSKRLPHLCDVPDQSKDGAHGEGEEVKLEEQCPLLLVAFLIISNEGSESLNPV